MRIRGPAGQAARVLQRVLHAHAQRFAPRKNISYYTDGVLPGELEVFRTMLLGPTDPGEAPQGSLRTKIPPGLPRRRLPSW